MQTETCDFCRAGFRPGMLKNGKCGPCEEKFPGAASMKEWKRQNSKPTEDEVDFEARVKKVVGEMLDEFGILGTCDCGERFYQNHPARKKCKSCKEAD